MRIVGTTNKNVSCIWTTIGKGIEEFGKIVNLQTTVYDREDFLQNRIQGTEEQTIFIFEAGTPQHAGYSMAKMKGLFPNSVFIALSSDAIIYKKHLGNDQLDYKYVDILLDVEDEAVEYYKRKYSLIGEKWLWTTSKWLMDKAESFYFMYMDELFHGRRTQIEFYDLICVALFSGPYRTELKKYLVENNIRLTNGGGCGHEDNDLHRLFTHYLQSKCTLGTTSHNNPIIRGMKGFRDWLGPCLGAPLIYDNYPQVMGAYGTVVPYYDYTDFSSIKPTMESTFKNRVNILKSQMDWLSNNTIEEQLYKVCKKYGVL